VRRLVAILLVLLLAACTSTTVSPRPTSSIPATTVPVTAPPASPSATPVPTVQPSVVAQSPALSPGSGTAFTTPVPPPAGATWTAIRWSALAPDDPLTLVRSILRWRGGFIAVGWDGSGTPVWTSRDGAHWDPLPVDTADTFWPGLLVVGVAEVPAGLVALTLLAGTYDCRAATACPTYSPTLPLMTWTSPDGRVWAPTSGAGPVISEPVHWQRAPLLASGPTGLVVASPTSPTRVATSADGVHWRTVPASALPSGLQIGALAGTAQGVTAVGTLPLDPEHERAVALQSTDGATWSGPYVLLDPTASVMLASTGESWGASDLVVGSDGLIAVGRFFATLGATLWWRSADGRTWQLLPGYPPLGPTTCIGEGCGSQPDGSLVGDGGRMVALRGGSDAGVWASADGLVWRILAVSGDVPDAQATTAGVGNQPVLLPGGILVSDGTTTWFGEAGTE